MEKAGIVDQFSRTIFDEVVREIVYWPTLTVFYKQILEVKLRLQVL
jgi:hypothetical protein